MGKLQRRFWDWTTETFVRLTIVGVVAYRLLSDQLKQKERH